MPEYEFEIDEEILEHLSRVPENIDNKIPLVIYVNYVKQYMINLEYEAMEVKVRLLDEEDNVMDSSMYYDYDTEFKLQVEAVDSVHYQVEAEVNGERIDNSKRGEIDVDKETELFLWTKQLFNKIFICKKHFLLLEQLKI